MKDIRIAFIGDSFINGTGDPDYLGWTGRVIQSIQKEYQNIELTGYNLGIRRETSSDILHRWENEVSSRLIDGEKFILVFSFGVNDCVVLDGKQRVDFKTSAQNLTNILSKAKNYGEVLFVMPPPIANSDINDRVEKLIGLYSKVCDETGIEYINIFDELKSNNIWMKETQQNDGAHPRSAGYEIFANNIIQNENWKSLWK